VTASTAPAAGRVLVVEDDPVISRVVTDVLQGDGFDVCAVADGAAGLELARAHPFDVVLLDLQLPGLSGIDLCRILRAESDVPIIMVTARTTEADRVLGLEIGADDYLTKPLSVRELTSRVRALLRRRELDRRALSTLSMLSTVAFGDITLEIGTRRATVAGGPPIDLTPSETTILQVLAERKGRPISRKEIAESLVRGGVAGVERTIDVHVYNLRRKLEVDASAPRYLVTVRNVGYSLQPGSR
jgi:DNA-binding response OmpR family regulator